MTMILEETFNMYNPQYDTITDLKILSELNNRLLCTFTDEKNLNELTYEIQNTYSILYNKMFILEIIGKDEYVITYNVEQANMNYIPENTILVHRKKESNTLYTINALNELIKKLNGGVVDTRFPINWQHYKNSVLLTQHNELHQLKTKIYKIIEL
jgi:hypothetical protein